MGNKSRQHDIRNDIRTWSLCMLAAFATYSDSADAADVCTAVSPNSVTTSYDGTLSASISGVMKIADAGGDISGKVTDEYTNDTAGVSESDRKAIVDRLIYLFCETVTADPTLSPEQKMDRLFEFQTVILSSLSGQSSTGSSTAKAQPQVPSGQLATGRQQGWMADSQTGCWAWDSFPADGQTFAWSGSCGTDGKATGQGEARWSAANSSEDVDYNGAMNDGNFEGKGSIYRNGWFYQGDFKNDVPDGNGILTANGTLEYNGPWHQGKAVWHRILLENSCSEAVSVSVLYYDADGDWHTAGWWPVDPKATVTTDRWDTSNELYIYARSSSFTWPPAQDASNPITRLITSSSNLPFNWGTNVASAPNSTLVHFVKVNTDTISVDGFSDGIRVDLTCG